MIAGEMCDSDEEPRSIIPEVSRPGLQGAFAEGRAIEPNEPTRHELNPEDILAEGEARRVRRHPAGKAPLT